MLKNWVVLAVLLALPAAAAAQDFGTEWIDRVTNEIQQERGPQLPKPVTFTALGGVAYYYDNNLYLTENDEEKSSVIIPFARARFEYATPTLDVQADLLANYKFYTSDHDLDDDEERLYVHLRQLGAKHTIELTGLFQHISDPTDSIFFDRVERVVATAIPKVSFDFTKTWTLELRADYQVLRYSENDLGDLYDNNSTRFDATLVWRSFWGFDTLAQFGYINIAYTGGQDSGAPPDAFGYYYRVGYRGELLASLSVEALVGYTTIETDFYRGTSRDEEASDVDASLALRYEATETVKFNATFVRLFTFAGGVDSYQLVNRFILGAEWQALQELTFRARGQFDATKGMQGTERQFWSGSLSGEYRISEHVILDAGATFRKGDTTYDNEVETDFTNLIFHLGLALAW